MVRGRLTLALVATALTLPCAARAELGGAMTPLQPDHGVMAPTSTMTTMGVYTRHDLTSANGGVVREFINGGGQVFAVTWSGPGKPDLRTFLGHYFATISSGAGAGEALHAPRLPLTVNQADLQIQTSGHMGWFRGAAYVPSLAPAGFNRADLTVGS